MFKRLFVLALLVQRNLISSEEVEDEKPENIRASRQLNFGDCCPCPGQDGFADQDSANTRVDTASVGDDSCPCRSTSDSEGVSSMFSPAFRAAEPIIRPVSKKEDPKPLLNPEVGLASSVLETLREVTDQEYQEALARDAARSALQFMDPELSNPEPRNLVNIIVNPKEENKGDIISEATDIQGNTCILPPLGMKNNFESLRLQPPMKLLKQILTPPKFTSNSNLNRNRFDMDGGASNTQEQILQPLKNNIFENMKTRSNLLNLKPFSNTDNTDFLTSPTILQKYYLKNSIKDRVLSRNRSLLDLHPKTSNKFKEVFGRNIAGNKELGIEQDEIPDYNQNSALSFSNNVREFKVSAEDNVYQNTDYTDRFREPNMSLKDYKADFDVVPSSSKTIEVENRSFIENPNVILQDRESDKCNYNELDTVTDSNNFNTLQSVTELNSFLKSLEVTTEVISEDTKIVDDQTPDLECENTTENLENMKDMESDSSIARSIVTNLQDAANSIEDDSKFKNANSLNLKNIVSFSSSEKDTINSKTHTLPNIKADIFRTLENFKKANEKIQEKLRSNVQDALQLASANEPDQSQSHKDIESDGELRTSSVEQIQKLAKNVTTTRNSINTQDLQKMSDSILELSSLKDKGETATSDCDVELKEELENKPGVGKISIIHDMITSPTSLNLNNDTIHLKDGLSNLYTKDDHINVTEETVEKCPNSIIPKSSESSNLNNEDNEMTAQPSNSIFNSISQSNLNPSKLGVLQRDVNAQPEDNNIRSTGGLKDLFNGFRSLSTDPFKNNDSGSVFFADQPLFGFNNDKIIDSTKSFTNGFLPKFNSDSNLSSYKAKVASPKSLDIKSLAPTIKDLHNEADVLGLASQGIPHTKNVIQNNVENGLNPLFKPIHTPKMLHDRFSSITPSISENYLKSHTNNALKTFRDSLDLAQRQPFTINKNNLLGKSLVNPDNLIGAMLKTREDFNDKLQAFHSDLNRRLSSTSPRMSSEGSRLLWTPSRLKNSKNRGELTNISSKNSETIPIKTRSSNMKNTLLSKNKPIFESLIHKTTDTAPRSNKADLLKPNIMQRPGILPHKASLSSRKGPITINAPKSYLKTKKAPKSNLKLKPLKENKVTITFATTSIRPDTLQSGFKPLHQTDHLKSTGGSVKFSTGSKNLLSKKPILKSKSKSNEPKVLASDISISRAELPDSVRMSKITQKVSSLEESHENLHDVNQNYDDKRSKDIPEANTRKSLLSKIKNTFATGISRGDAKRNNKVLSSRQIENVFDATQSASNNIDTNIISATSLTSKDNNQSFKCKMVCIKDILDSTDTLY